MQFVLRFKFLVSNEGEKIDTNKMLYVKGLFYNFKETRMKNNI